MKRYRSIISSGSSSDESPTLSKPTRKSTKMADQRNVEGVDLEHMSLKDLFTQINSMKRDIDSGLDNQGKHGKPETGNPARYEDDENRH